MPSLHYCIFFQETPYIHMAQQNWRKREGVVFSTRPDFEFDYNEPEEQSTLSPAEQQLRVMLDKKQRAGKSVTLVTGFVGSADDLKELGKKLKQVCGVGGSAKDGEIIIQGDFREKVAAVLTAGGYKVKLLK